MTFLDIVTLTLLGLLAVGVWWWALEHLGLDDYLTNRESQCPPHEWVSTYMDGPDEQSVYAGLRCVKCKQRPGNFRRRTCTWPDGPLTP